MANIKRANASGITKSGTAISDVPDAPTIGAVSDLGTGSTASVAYTAAATGGAATTFTATSSPGGFTGTGSSPITVSGLSIGVAYTFTVTASNSTGSATSGASSSLTLADVGKYESIATVTVGSGGSSLIEFTSISASYTNLQIRGIARSADASAGGNLATYIRFNGDTAANYSFHQLAGNSAGALISSSGANQSLGYVHHAGPRSGDLASTFSAMILDILDYKNTNKFKTVKSFAGHSLNNNQASRVGLNSVNWRSTSAITSIQIYQEGNFAQYSTFALYGIKV